jgi:hypothetical protein
MSRWRQIIDKSIPRNDIMEIAWENIPAAWEQEMAALRVRSPPRPPGVSTPARGRDVMERHIADDSPPKRQKKINLPNVLEHNYMAFTDPYCNIVRQGKSQLLITSIDSYTTLVVPLQRWPS